MRYYFWDFFGDAADATARHFERHLAARLGELGIEHDAVGVRSEGEGHAAAYCRVPQASFLAVERSFRPKRALGADEVDAR